MNNDGNACGKERVVFYLQVFLHGIWQWAINRREVYPAFFENASVLNYAGKSAASLLALPVFFGKSSDTINCLEGFAYVSLKLGKTGFYLRPGQNFLIVGG